MSELSRERWERIETIYEGVLALPSDRRGRYVADACAGDPALRDEILAMLAADETGATLAIERLVREDDPVSDPLVGTTIGPWRIVAAIGRGGSGAVYLVERCDGQYEQQAALKLLAPGVLSREAAARLAAERRILARLVHPNIARLIDGGLTTNGTPYLVMEYVEGQPLTVYSETRDLSIDARLRLFRVVCDAVQHAHRALVVHRDLKPSNIYVSQSGDVKLLDFGIAKLLGDDSLLPPTQTGLRSLTPAYAAPEQLRGDAVTTAADVYGLGVVLYELLTGRRPHAIETMSPAEAERAVLEKEPAPPSAVAPPSVAKRIRGDLDRICLMALRKEPERRYASVDQFAHDIEHLLAGRPVSAQPDTLRYRTRRFVRRNRVAVAVAALFVVVLSSFAITAVVQARQVAAERDRARFERDKAQRVTRIVIDLFQAANPEVVPDGDKQTVSKFLEAAEVRALAGLGSDVELSATIKDVLGQVHDARNDFPRARQLLEQALAESRAARGLDDPDTLMIQVNLGALLVRLEDRGGARQLLGDALARCERTVGERHALTAKTLYVLGNTTDQLEQGRPHLQRALSIYRALPDTPASEMALALNALAIADMDARKFDDARAEFSEALRVIQTVNSGRHTTALAVLNNMAVLLARTGDLGGAEDAHRRALVLAGELRGENSMAFANGLNNLGTVFANQGKLEAAFEQYQLAHAKYAGLVGEAHARTANAARNAGVTLLLLERPDEALPWMERALRGYEASRGTDTRDTVYVRAQHAVVLSALGRHEEAIPRLRAAAARLSELAPAQGHGTLADAQVYLGRALFAAGRRAEAEPHYRSAVAFWKPGVGDPRSRATSECELALVVAAGGQHDEARRLLAGCVPLARDSGMIPPSRRAAIVKLYETLR